MPQKIIVTISAFIFIVLLPYLEISETHLFNPDWTGHARIHEAWQLTTHAALACFALWLAWGRRETRLAGGLCLIVNGGFLFAYLVRGLYGGTMAYANGDELLVFGVNPSFGVLAVVSVGLVFVVLSRPGDAHS